MRSIVWRRVEPGVGAVTGTLFEAHARASDPDTSQAAAAAVDARGLEQRVLAAVDALGGEATVKEIADRSGLDKWSVSPRIAPLRRKGLLVDSGARR